MPPKTVCIARGKHKRLRFAGGQRRAGEQDVAASQQVILVADAGVPRHRPGFSVTVALFTRTPNASSTRQSAGTSSPALNRITSPARVSSAGSTTTVALALRSHLMRQQRCSAAIVSSARYSCQKEKRPLTTITPAIAAASVASPALHLNIRNQREHGRQPQEQGREVRERCGRTV
jgi:hypothetical protein